MINSHRKSLIGALQGLLVAENGGDIIDEVFIICDVIGISRPEENDGTYKFTWLEENDD